LRPTLRRWLLVGIAIVVILAVAAVVLTTRFDDTALYVSNQTTQSWYLAVERREGPTTYTAVVRVDPGADAFGLSWQGGGNTPVRVLAADCSFVGNVVIHTDDRWEVEGVPGLSGHVERHGPPNISREGTKVSPTQDCGGVVFF
jgi:hypothetical protein